MNSQGPWWPSWHPSCPRVCTGSRSHPPRPPGEPLQLLGLPLQYPRLAIQWRRDPECQERWIGGFAEPNLSKGKNLPNRSPKLGGLGGFTHGKIIRITISANRACDRWRKEDVRRGNQSCQLFSGDDSGHVHVLKIVQKKWGLQRISHATGPKKVH